LEHDDTPPDNDVTRTLLRVDDADDLAANQLFTLVYDELHRIARRAMRSQKPCHTLQATALVNEAWLKMFGGSEALTGRNHFLGAAARAMRSVLVDHARARSTGKREPNGERVFLDEMIDEYGERAGDLIVLDEALSRLNEVDPSMVRLVELRFFAGLSSAQAADVLGVSARTAAREWATARAWLRKALR
jgi:RNA polymerase sigma factor (TIGR02999 family)